MSNNSELLSAVKDVYAGAQPEPEQFDDGHNNDFEPHYAMRNRPTPLVRLDHMVGNGVVGLYMAAWGGGRWRKLVSAGVAATVAAGMVPQHFDTTARELALGVYHDVTGQDNDAYFTTPGCTDPLVQVKGMNYQASVALPVTIYDEDPATIAAKKAADPNYSPPTTVVEDPKKLELPLPATPFDSSAQTQNPGSRLLATQYSGPFAIGLCDTSPDLSAFTPNRSGVVSVDLTKLKPVVLGDTQNTIDGTWAYERFAFSLDPNNPQAASIPLTEVERLNRLLVPDPANPAKPNDAIMTQTKYSALNKLDQNCAGPMSEAIKSALEAYVHRQLGRSTIVWYTGTATSPAQAFRAGDAMAAAAQSTGFTLYPSDDSAFTCPKFIA
jgi:hypothetical protein